MNIRLVFILVIFGIFSGCARIPVTYLSDPPGAMIYEESRGQLGNAPVRVYYTPTDQDKQRGYMYINPVTARWISGVEIGGAPSTLPIDGVGKTYVFKRPNEPGLELDLQADYQRKQLQLQQQQVRQQQQYMDQKLQQQQQQNQLLQQQNNQLNLNQNTPRNCNSQWIGNQWVTNCY
jgi:hypothetical protein